MRVEIDCIKKNPRQDPYHAIQEVGGHKAGGGRWCLPLSEAVAGAESGKWQFYVSQGARTINVVVATRLGHKYLKTIADGERPDNLLSLRECR